MGNNQVFIVLSVIYHNNRRLSYSKVRSQFTPQERVHQTIKTIESIRQKAPGARILLLESGLKEELPLSLGKLADRYVYLGGKFLVRLSCDSIFKGVGEAVSLLSAKKYILEEKADYYFKISGRYFLNDDFRREDWGQCRFAFRVYGKDFSTRLYGFRKEAVGAWFSSLLKGIPRMFLNQPIEHTMPKYIPQMDICRLRRLGVSGYGSAFGEFFQE